MSLLLRLENILGAKIGGKIFHWLGHFEKCCLKEGTVALNCCLALGLKMLKIQIFMKIHTNFKGINDNLFLPL
jgi:hypothetical protein